MNLIYLTLSDIYFISLSELKGRELLMNSGVLLIIATGRHDRELKGLFELIRVILIYFISE